MNNNCKQNVFDVYQSMSVCMLIYDFVSVHSFSHPISQNDNFPPSHVTGKIHHTNKRGAYCIVDRADRLHVPHRNQVESTNADLSKRLKPLNVSIYKIAAVTFSLKTAFPTSICHDNLKAKTLIVLFIPLSILKGVIDCRLSDCRLSVLIIMHAKIVYLIEFVTARYSCFK